MTRKFFPILDLRPLNRYLKVLKFCMLHTADVLQGVKQDDWFTTIDLKDSYFHCSPSQTVPALCLRGEGPLILCAAVRNLTGTRDLHKICGSSTVSTTEQRYAHFPLPRRLVNLFPVKSRCTQRLSPASLACHRARAHSELQQELPNTQPAKSIH